MVYMVYSFWRFSLRTIYDVPRLMAHIIFMMFGFFMTLLASVGNSRPAIGNVFAAIRFKHVGTTRHVSGEYLEAHSSACFYLASGGC